MSREDTVMNILEWVLVVGFAFLALTEWNPIVRFLLWFGFVFFFMRRIKDWLRR